MMEGSRSIGSHLESQLFSFDDESITLSNDENQAILKERKGLVGIIILSKAFNIFSIINMLKKG